MLCLYETLQCMGLFHWQNRNKMPAAKANQIPAVTVGNNKNRKMQAQHNATYK